MTGATLLLHLGDAQHGVDRLARELAAAIAAIDASATRLARPDDVPDGARVHLHFTDRLWGGSPDEAAHAIERVARRATVSVTLHDVPQPSDGAASMARRAAAYARVAQAATRVVCNSEHERALLAEHVGDVPHAVVVPLPCDRLPGDAASTPSRREVGVLGFFYPGKGHREAVDASAALPSPLPVVAIGRAAAGHEGELQALVDEAASLGVDCSSTGFLDDDALVARMRETLVPVVAHRHVSASGSLNSWIAAGRRPIVVRGAYFEEMAALRPGTTWLVSDDGLAAAIAAAVADPSRTRLAPHVSTAPTSADVAAAYLALWSRS